MIDYFIDTSLLTLQFLFVRIYRSTLPTILTLVFGSILSALVALAIAQQEQDKQRLQFQRKIDGLATSLQRNVNRYTDILLSICDFYAVSNQSVSRSEFDQFVERVLAINPGVQALEWAPIVVSDSLTETNAMLRTRTAFEAEMKAEGYADFYITEQPGLDELVRTGDRRYLVRAGERDYYVPVTYLQPVVGNELAFGYDVNSNTTRRLALTKARETGNLAASGRIRLVQESKDQFGFLVFLPLYSSGTTPESAQERQDQLQGYVLGVFRVADVVEESIETIIHDIDFKLTDRSASEERSFLGFYQASTRGVTTIRPRTQSSTVKQKKQALCPDADACTHQLSVGGREWAITFTPAENYASTTPWRGYSAFAIGILLTFVISLYLAQAQNALIKTQELSALKTRLFSMASHELRTPLSTILLSAQILEANVDSADSVANRSKIYSRIQLAARRMNHLIERLLMLARAESGKLVFSPKTFNIKSFCQQTIEEVQFRSINAPTINLDISPTVPTAVYLDPQLLRFILSNLLSNAVKYSKEEPQISLKVYDRARKLVFQVSDRGIGISKSDRARINEAFYRGENVGEISGTGLGLSVVSVCLKLHRGSLVCKSKLDRGSTFIVTLPYE